ncbi:MAG: hypothetical protein IJQ11_10050 [Bacteroidales bacterium]|nr:hypothetical protein [Bacteroidales bacterium]
MKAKKNIDLKSIIDKAIERNNNAVAPSRFYLPYDCELVKKMLGVKYKAEVLSRIQSENYKQLDAELVQNIGDVAKWLCDPQKRPGLLLFGKVGTGKTTLLRAICATINEVCERDTYENGTRENTLDNFRCISIVKAKGIINDYINPQSRPRYELMTKVSLMAIDELGVEPMESKSYGNVSEPLIDLFCERYDRQLLTIVSTNLGNAEIRQRYGTRLADRFNEMFATIPFNGQSFRK